MTFKDLQKLVDSQQQSGPVLSTVPKDIPFWIFDPQQHRQEDIRTKGQCCFYHLLGPAQKEGKDMPLLPWQKLFWNMLHERRKIWVKKSRGIGLSTLMLYVIAYKCLTEFKPGDRVVIITGIRIETAADLVRRFKLLFQKNFPEVYIELSKQKDTIAIVNGVIVECYPAAHTDSIRGLDRVKLCWVDEGDMFGPSESRNIRGCVEGFLPKPNSENMYLILSSTPAKPMGLFETIEREDPSIYYKMFLPYQYGLEGPSPIYTQEYIDEMRQKSPEFPREFELQYIGVVGNVFSQASIELCQKIQYNPQPFKQNVKTACGVDAGFGSSKFGIVITQLFDNRIHVMFAEEYDRPNFNEMISKVWELKQQCGYMSNIMVDAANPEIIEALKREFGESTDWNYIHDRITWCKQYNQFLEDSMFIVPVPFSVGGGRKMLQHAKYLLEDPEGLVAIHPSFQKLLISLRTAVATEYKLDKTQTSHNDCLDAFMLSLQFYKRSK